MGLDVYLANATSGEIQIDSTLYPDHMFKIGYFRSSYNNSGINTVLGDIGIPSLYEIFLPGDAYTFTPDWQAALERTDSAISAFDAAVSQGVFGAFFVSAYDYNVASNADAICVFKQQLRKQEEHDMGFRSFSNREGYFCLDGTEIVAVIPGKGFFANGAYVVFERDRESLEWYRHALEIVRETIQHVLAQEDPTNYHLEWSS
jgi:hypothetical protein